MVSFFAASLLLAVGLTPEQQARLAKFEDSLLAPCCYQERVATHASDTAKAMRAELAQMVAQGKPDRGILILKNVVRNQAGGSVLEGEWTVMMRRGAKTA